MTRPDTTTRPRAWHVVAVTWVARAVDNSWCLFWCFVAGLTCWVVVFAIGVVVLMRA